MQIFELEQSTMQLPIREVAERLSVILGLKNVAYLSGKRRIAVVERWISGNKKPGRVETLRLQYGYIAAAILTRNHNLTTARSVFGVVNIHLDGCALLEWLRQHNDKRRLRSVIEAARAFGEN